MAANFEVDELLAQIQNLPNIPQGWKDEVTAFALRTMRSNMNSFGEVALRDTGVGGGQIPPVQGDGLLAANLFPHATTTQRGLMELASDSEVASGSANDKAVTAAQVSSLVSSLGAVADLNPVSTQAFDVDSMGFFQWFNTASGRSFTEFSELPAITEDVAGNLLWHQLPRLSPNAHQPASTVWRRRSAWQQAMLADPVNHEPIPSPHSGQQFEHGYLAVFIRVR